MSTSRDVLFITELSEKIGLSVRQIQRMRRAKTFPIPELLLDSRPRWTRADVEEFLATRGRWSSDSTAQVFMRRVR